MSGPDPVSASAAAIAKESRAALAAYVDRCKQMTPEEFLAEPASRRARLSVQQQMDIINTILGRYAPQNLGPSPVDQLPDTRPTSPTAPKSRWARVRRLWKGLGQSGQAMVIGILAVLVAPAVLWAIEPYIPLAFAILPVF